MAILDIPLQGGGADFTTISGSPLYVGTGTGINGGYMQSYLLLDGGSTPESVRWNLAAGLSDFWFHCRMLCEHNATSDVPFITLRGGSTDLFRLSVINANEDWMVEYYNGATWTQVGSDITTVALSNLQIDIHITMSDTVGVYEVFANRVSVASLGGGDTIFTAETNIDDIQFSATGTSASFDCFYSDFLTANEDTREFVLVERTTIAQGDLAEWAGLDSSIDDELWSPVDGSSISSDTAAQKSTHTMLAHAIEFDTDFDIRTVWQVTRARGEGPTSLDVRSNLRKSSVNYPGSTHTVTTSFVDYIEEWALDPSTAAPWANAAAIEAMQFGVESI